MKRFYKSSPDSLLTLADQLPPNLCRMLARDQSRRGRALSNAEIADVAGLTEAMVARLARRKTWRGVAIEVIDAFRLGCGITPKNAAYHLRYLARTHAVSARPLFHIESSALSPKTRKGLMS